MGGGGVLSGDAHLTQSNSSQQPPHRKACPFLIREIKGVFECAAPIRGWRTTHTHTHTPLSGPAGVYSSFSLNTRSFHPSFSPSLRELKVTPLACQ